ncbi:MULTISPECIES: CHASE2 domain-containing protein [unclassified Acidovorax]|uniref:CHASE2 domain-containing protein n=1 Tax=unclassified Acidovorax TaxID=2684926 RepID=UPI001C452366|nr:MULTISPECIES: CHASE2 domain-containing protein [unclassified Acidovorax]MBV7427386.1 CHASE2 domain-containing protein [Acidovorax sp. sif0732]MBV7449746.1 CHASE2 domain-containing protein [Acidovorax sp. sif0715]
MRTAGRTRGQQRRLEWSLLSIALLGLVAWLSTADSLSRVNHLVQDAGLRLISRPAHPDIVIVAIDDPSIAAIGRWPWRRALHAELIARVSAQQPRAIGMDVLFNEEDLDYPGDDVLLADAMQRSGRVVLPVLRRGHGPAADTADLPWPAFADAAARLGHVHVVPDNDGVVRSLYLQEGPAAAPWPHFSMALQCVADPALSHCAAPRAGPGNAEPARMAAPGPWQRADRTLIAYAGGPGHFTTYSYIAVLRGQVPADAFRGKYVLVGAAAAGLGDMFATPMSQQSRLMPGVEVVAQVLDGRLSGVRIQPAAPALNTLFNLAPVAGALLALLLVGPFIALLTSAGLGVATLLLSVALPWWVGLQFAPAAALTGLVLAYPLWSWRRLSAAAHFLRLEMERLQRDGLSMRLQPRTGDSGDFLEKRINAVERASRQLRDLHHFVSESLQQLPSPTIVCDPQGRILLTNVAARRHVGGDPLVPLQGQSVVDLLHDLVQTGTGQPLITQDKLLNQCMPEQSEGSDAQGRSLLVQCRPFTDLAKAGWLMTLVDLTEMRRAQLQRDQAMNFISHDIRTPNASILTLLEMQRAYPGRMPGDELMLRIERYARASLGMAENFVKLASAETQEYRMAPLDLVAALAETVDDIWALARDRGVEVTIAAAPETAPAVGDRAMLCRALANVLHNAVKFSPEEGVVQCSIVQRGRHWVVSVRDEGPGIAPELQGQLFAPFRRLHDRSHPAIGGVGLGLALVHTVIQRHGGTLEVDSDAGRGAEFRLVLPLRA